MFLFISLPLFDCFGLFIGNKCVFGCLLATNVSQIDGVQIPPHLPLSYGPLFFHPGHRSTLPQKCAGNNIRRKIHFFLTKQTRNLKKKIGSKQRSQINPATKISGNNIPRKIWIFLDKTNKETNKEIERKQQTSSLLSNSFLPK